MAQDQQVEHLVGPAVRDALGIEVKEARPMSGGDVAASFRIALGDGSVVFAKTRVGASPEFFETEARGLRWLRDAEALLVPEVLAVGIDTPLLVLEWIEQANGRPVAHVRRPR